MSEWSESSHGPILLSKWEIAKQQLDRALLVFLDERDYVCSITLGGAAEEIFGQFLKRQGRKTAKDKWVELCLKEGRFDDVPENRKAFTGMLNWHRNELKHHDGRDGDGPEEELAVDRGDAIDILQRAIDNYQALALPYSELILRFQVEIDQD